MNDYKEIRQRYLAGQSQRRIAKDLHISRNTVKKYCAGGAVPWEHKPRTRAATQLTEETIAFIQACLESDEKEGLKKQKHTAKRIYDRLVEEMGFTGGESTVRRKVRELKNRIPHVFIPLQFEPGEVMQVDWGSSIIYLNEERITINLFCARLCYSRRPVVLAYRHQNEESFLDAFVKTFTLFGGVTRRVIFDNAKVAVKEGFGAKARKQAGYAALCAHYGFDASFCNPGEGHEKGLVEGLVGWARRNICVPVPKVTTLEELNILLLERCRNYESHTIKGRPETVGGMYVTERAALRPLPLYPFEVAKCISARVSTLSTVRFLTNDYSVPVRYAGCMVDIKGYPESVEIFARGQRIASHARCFGRHQASYHLEDYMPLLESRHRAIPNAAPVKQNVPQEVMDEIIRDTADSGNAIHIIKDYTKSVPNHHEAEALINDPISIQSVDLHQYDALRIGKAVYRDV